MHLHHSHQKIEINVDMFDDSALRHDSKRPSRQGSGIIANLSPQHHPFLSIATLQCHYSEKEESEATFQPALSMKPIASLSKDL
jgi:hypothetical protein